tara:strand:- start:6605 stop:7504 length:900 start_codon:yes stop_codon:yes gene_type:complete
MEGSMQILLTGGSGFLGRHLLPLLENHQVLVLGRRKAVFPYRNVSYLRCDLSDTSTWKKRVRDFSPDAGIHLAWTGLPDYSLSRCLENFNSTINLLNILLSAGCKTIFTAGTCWEYGNVAGQVREIDIPGPMSLYPSFKTGLHLISESMMAECEANLIWGRVFFVYGPGQRESSIIPTCYKAIKNGMVPVVKNPDAINDFVHISDVVGAIKALVEAPGVSGVFNLGSGTPGKVRQVCGYVARKLNAESKIPDWQNQGEQSGFWADISLIKKRTGWEPKLSLEEGIEQTIDEWEEANDRS